MPGPKGKTRQVHLPNTHRCMYGDSSQKYINLHNSAIPDLQVRVQKFVPNKKGDIGMEVYYL